MKIIVDTGKTASGKDSVASKIAELYNINYVVSTTTRDIREGEVEGINYNFTENTDFERMIEAGELSVILENHLNHHIRHLVIYSINTNV